MKILLTFLLLILTVIAVNASDVNTFYKKGNELYSKSKYDEAIVAYKEALKLQELPELHYNLGNAYYKSNQLGQAILHFEKALLIRPTYEQAQDNLNVANSRIVDKIDNSTRKTLGSFWLSLKQQTGVSTFGAYTLICWIISALLFSLFLLTSKAGIKKAGFFSGSFFLLISLFLLYLTLSTQNELEHNKWAIVTTDKVDALTEPKSGSSIAFVIHEGTKVHVNSYQEDWMEIQLENGGVGWVENQVCTEI